MTPKSSISGLAVLSCFLLLSSAATAFNITRLFGRFPEYNTMSDLLIETGLAKEINSRLTITVLAVDNGAIGGLSGKPRDVIKNILSSHVILDYFDVDKLHKLKKSIVVTTLFQASGIASSQQGFLNVTNMPNGEVLFGSAIKDSPLDVKLVNILATQPYNLSVIQVSGLIVAPGIDGSFTPPPAGAPKQASTSSPVPFPPKDQTNGPSPSSNEEQTPAETPVETLAETPAETPTETPKESPAADANNEKAAPPHSSAMRCFPAASGFFVGLLLAFLLAVYF